MKKEMIDTRETSVETMEKKVADVLLDEKIDLVLNVPCGMMKTFISEVDENILFPISRESVGIGIAFGAYLAGAKPLLLIQNTGLGNSIINLAALHMNYEVPLPILFSWRGKELENIVAQNNFGNLTEGLLDAMGINYTIAKQKEDFPNILQTIQSAFNENKISGCLISPMFWNTLKGEELTYTSRTVEERKIEQKRLNESEISLTRYGAIETIVEEIESNDPEGVIVCNLGIPSMELHDIIEKRNSSLRVFYMLAGFGEVSAIGLGLSMYSDRNIYVLDGDGSLFHNPNVFDSIVAVSPKNLTIFALDNGVHSSTGNQMTMTHLGINLESIAQAYGFKSKNTNRILNGSELKQYLEHLPSGPNFSHVIVKRGNAKVSEVPMSCVEIKEQFMNSL